MSQLIGDMIESYVKKRDMIAAKTAAFNEHIKPDKDAMTQIEGDIMVALDAAKLTSMKGANGTA